jgi:hypothetical protein
MTLRRRFGAEQGAETASASLLTSSLLANWHDGTESEQRVPALKRCFAFDTV